MLSAICTYVGKTTTFGTDVYANEEVMKCDLKISISSVVPHPMNGFGGAGKIILPGVTSFETTAQNHQSHNESMKEHQDRPVAGMGVFDDNPLRFDIEEAATLAGLGFTINCIINLWGETVALYAGALKPSYAAAVKEAKANYLTPKTEVKNVAISIGFSKSNEAFIGASIAYRTVSHENSDVVIIANNPEGLVTHYLLGPFGTTGKPSRIPDFVNHLIVYSEYPDFAGRGWFGDSDKLLFLHMWDDVIQVLPQSHGVDTIVAVYPNSEIQYWDA
ncbi:MAG: lactate racemase domain-containing protein [Dehalococcoidales bacterium]